jgi:natural product biosynthesis luciferase-like monooxygenase protein
MGNYFDRLGALTPEQRALLDARLKKKGLGAAAAESEIGAPLTVPLPAAKTQQSPSPKASAQFNPKREMKFSLYFFSDDGSKPGPNKYGLLIEAARFADDNGFTAVWTPERHFQTFGGLYPNPSVVSAALAVMTNNVQIRAGSVALPLHHPARVAEEWSVVDNLSNGRAAVSIASGWHRDDFVFAPSIYEKRKQVMFEYVEAIQRLWAGEELEFEGASGALVKTKILPRPIQPRLPIWVTTAGSPETWARAGEIGANVLAALAGYSFSDLADRIQMYRQSRERYGHDPKAGTVSVMVHTYIGDDEDLVKRAVRAPMCWYLRSYFEQFQTMGAEDATDDDKNTVVAAAFEQYYDSTLLIGTPEKCRDLVDRLQQSDVDEVACLIDFGLDQEVVLDGLVRLAALRGQFSEERMGQHDLVSQARVGLNFSPDGRD